MLAVVCKCGKSYQLNERHVGHRLRCRRCGEELPAADRQLAATVATPPAHDVARRTPAIVISSADAPPRGDDKRTLADHSSGPAPNGGHEQVRACQDRVYYRVVQDFARGGMGQVSIARDESLKRDVALKELLDDISDLPTSQQRFVAEAEITGQLEHPGVVPVYALGSDEQGKPFYAMRLVKGQTLTHAIDEYHQSRAPAALNELLRRFVMVCQTVAYAHQRGVVHRDLKPANIMLGQFGETLVMDWGLAKAVREGESRDSTLGDVAQRQLAADPGLTASDGVVGTPAYMPPEQALGKVAEVGVAADTYSLGAVLYQILTGRPPYSGASSAEVLEKVKKSSPPKPSAVRRGMPPALEAICLKAMSRRPKGRYATALELAESVKHWLDDDPVDAYAERITEKAYRWSRKHKSTVVSAVAALIAVVVIGSVATVLYQRERDKASVFERIAADNSRQAADAEKRAREKEAEADRLAHEAADSRRQANEAALKEAEARQAADQAKQQIAQVEAALAAKTGDAEALAKKLESARGELAGAEARGEAESKRADAAVDRAAELEQQVVALRREADEYREVALRLTRLAELAANQTASPAIGPSEPWNDFTQGDPAAFDAVGNDESAGAAVADTTRLRTGRQSLRVSTNTGDVRLTYPKGRNANWDLSKYDYLTFAFSMNDEDVRYRDSGLIVRIGRGSQSIEYRATPEALSLVPKGWAFVKIPFWGNNVWKRTEVNPLHLSHVDWIELHVSTSSPKLSVWVEDMKFGADPRHIDRELLPDPDRAAAEYVVATKGEVQAWASGRPVTIRTAADIPAEPFKIVNLGYSTVANGENVTPAGLKLFASLTDCRSLGLSGARITDADLKYLKDMRSLEALGVGWSPGVNGSGLTHLASHAKLTSLAANFSAINDEGMTHLAAFPKLAYLDISNTHVTDEGLKRVSTHPRLSAILLCDTPITAAGLAHLKSLPAGLQHLGVGTTNAPRGIAVLQGAPIRTLSIGAAGGANGRVEAPFLESLRLFPELATVSARDLIIDADLAKGLAKLERMTALDFGLELSPAADARPAARDGALRHLAAAPSLESLSIHNGGRMSDASLEDLAALTTLKALVLYRTFLEPASVLKLQKALPNCKITVDPAIQQAIDKLRETK